MPTALQRSRDILASGVARLRAGLKGYARNIDDVGPEIKVEPFDARNVSTPVALIKLGTTIAAAHRHRANYEEAKQGLELEREKTRAEIARLRAQAAYEMGEGRQPASPAAKSTEETPYQKDVIALRKRALDQADRARTDRTNRVNRVPAARAALSQIDKNTIRDAEIHARDQMAQFEGVFQRVTSNDQPTRHGALKALGIDPATFDAYVKSGYDVSDLLKNAREALQKRVVATARSRVEQYYRPKRQQYEAVINEAAGGEPADPLGAGPTGDEEDPLNLGGP